MLTLRKGKVDQNKHQDEKELSMEHTCVVATGEIVSSIFLATYELLRVEELAICSSSNFINHSGLKINKNSTRDMLPCTSFTEKGVESIITSANSLVTWHLAIRL